MRFSVPWQVVTRVAALPRKDDTLLRSGAQSTVHIHPMSCRNLLCARDDNRAWHNIVDPAFSPHAMRTCGVAIPSSTTAILQ